jgi:hypothetical protein
MEDRIGGAVIDKCVPKATGVSIVLGLHLDFAGHCQHGFATVKTSFVLASSGLDLTAETSDIRVRSRLGYRRSGLL